MRKARRSLAILLAVVMVLCMVPAMGFAADNGDSEAVTRIDGNNRWDTAAKTALEKFGTADKVIVARGDDEGNFADGLAASYLAKVKDAPILLTNPNSLPQETKNAIKQLEATTAYVLGGELAVSEAVFSELKGLELDVERIDGGNRFDTAAKIAREGGNVDTALVVSGNAPADSLIAGSVAFNNGYPILLVQKDNVPDATDEAIKDLGIKNTYVVGGELVVSGAVYDQLGAKARYCGTKDTSRVGTSIDVAQKLFEEPKTFSIVGRQDKNLADAVGAAVLGNPIIYVGDDISGIQEYLAEVLTDDTQFVILGGTLAVSEAVQVELEELLVPEEVELNVESVSAIDANTISVTFDNEETVEIELEEALVHGQTEVTFVYEEVEYTAELTEAWVDEAVVIEEAAEEAVAAYEAATITTFDNVAATEELKVAAEEAVALVEDEEVVEALEARIADQEEALQEIVDAKLEAVNKAANEVTLLSALEDFFNNVDESLIADYRTVLGTGNAQDSVAEVQAEINRINVVGEVNDAETQVQLLRALNKGQELGVFEGVREDYIVTYADTILPAGVLTAQQIQDVIDGAANAVVTTATTAVENAEADPTDDALIETAEEEVAKVPADLVNEDEESYRELLEARVADVKVVNDVLAAEAVSSVRLLNSLKANEFENIVDDSIDQYKFRINGLSGAVTVEDIQDEIDAENLVVATGLVGAIDENSTTAEIAEAQAAIDVLVDGDDKEALQDTLDTVLDGAELQRALNDVLALTGADSDEDIKAALKTLAGLSEDFDYATVTEAYLNDYAVAIAAGSPADAADIQDIIETVAYDAVEALTGADTDEDIKAALKALDKASEDFDYATVIESLLNDYAVAIAAGSPADAADIQDIITGVPEATAAALTGSDTDADILAALTALAQSSNAFDINTVNEDLLNEYAVQIAADSATTAAAIQASVVEVNNLAEVNAATDAYEMRTALNKVAVAEDVANYINLSSAAKLEVAEVVLAERPNNGYANTAAVTGEVSGEISARDTLFTAATGINLGTITEVRAALVAYGLDAFDLGAAAQVEVAEYLVNNRPEVKVDDSDNYVSGGYTTIAQIEAAIVAALAE